MNKILTGALAALTLTGAAIVTASPAAAQPWHGGYGHRGWGPGVAVGAGLLGLAVGAAIVDHPHYAEGYGYGYRGPFYGGGYYGCRTVARWNPYWGGYQRVRACY